MLEPTALRCECVPTVAAHPDTLAHSVTVDASACQEWQSRYQINEVGGGKQMMEKQDQKESRRRYIYIYAYTRIHTHTYIHIYIDVYIYIYI